MADAEQTIRWPNLKQAVKGMKEIIELAKAGRLPPLDEPPPN